MMENIRSALACAGICLGIFLTAQLLRTCGALSFLPESNAGNAVAVLGNMAAEEGWSDGLVAVFAAVGK
ncbi:MAG: hypothetical protein LUE11_06230 [Clostridia bacterium]|nr:hypothetical protein [Clostridia bacterium]